LIGMVELWLSQGRAKTAKTVASGLGRTDLRAPARRSPRRGSCGRIRLASALVPRNAGDRVGRSCQRGRGSWRHDWTITQFGPSPMCSDTIVSVRSYSCSGPGRHPVPRRRDTGQRSIP
jgi:hypothetical protein